MARSPEKPGAGQSNSRPGRPPRTAASTAPGDARRRLLEAAAQRFAAQGFAATSLRQVADDAGVTPAMVAYYFRDKAGLMEAVLIEGLELILVRLREVMEPAPQARGSGRPLLTRFVGAYVGALNDHPWIPRIVVQEVISRDTPLRDVFVERFAREALALLAPRVAGEVEAGRLRRDLDPRLTVISVIGMCVFPYIAEPLLGRLLGLELDDEFAAAFVPHTVGLLRHGLEPGA